MVYTIIGDIWVLSKASTGDPYSWFWRYGDHDEVIAFNQKIIVGVNLQTGTWKSRVSVHVQQSSLVEESINSKLHVVTLLNNTYDSNRFKVKPIVYISNLHSEAIFLMVVS